MFGSNGFASFEEAVEEPLVDVVVSSVIGITEGGAFNVYESDVIPATALGFKRGLDISQAVFASDLSVEQGDKLLPAGEIFYVAVPSVPFNQTFKLMSGYELQQLVVDCAMMGHGLNLLSLLVLAGDNFITIDRISSLLQIFSGHW